MVENGRWVSMQKRGRGYAFFLASFFFLSWDGTCLEDLAFTPRLLLRRDVHLGETGGARAPAQLAVLGAFGVGGQLVLSAHGDVDGRVEDLVHAAHLFR